MSYNPLMTAALSGATLSQLAYWRRPSASGHSVLVPEVSVTRPVLYSFRDLVALRTCVYLRESAPLQRIRRAIATLNKWGDGDTHLSEYTLVADGHSILLVEDPESAVDLVVRPGQRVLAGMRDVFEPFNVGEVVVPDLYNPRPELSVDPSVRGGQPVVRDTRVQFDLVADLMRDGVPAEDVAAYYPSVSSNAAAQAFDFSEYVSSYDARPLAASR